MTPAGRSARSCWRRHRRIGAAVLTNCDAFGTFPPRALAPLFRAAASSRAGRLPGAGAPVAKVRTARSAFGPLTSAPLDAELTRDWIEPLAARRSAATWPVRAGVRPGVLLDAASRFGQFTGPVRILWGDDDPFFRHRAGAAAERGVPARQPDHGAGRPDVPAARPPRRGRQRDHGRHPGDRATRGVGRSGCSPGQRAAVAEEAAGRPVVGEGGGPHDARRTRPRPSGRRRRPCRWRPSRGRPRSPESARSAARPPASG